MSFLKRTAKAQKKRKAPRTELSPLHKQLIWGVVLFIVVALVLTGVWYLSRIESLQIERIEVVGGKTIPHSRIESLVNTALRGEYLRLIPKRFVLTYPKQSIEEAIYSIDRIKNVHIERKGEQTLLIAFEEYVPHALWCGDVDGEQCFFIEYSGLAFAQAPELDGSAFVRYIDFGVTPKQDAYGFSDVFLKDTTQFIELLESDLDLYVTHVVKSGDYDVDYVISGGGRIKVSQTISMQESFKNLKTILFSDAFKHIEPGSFQYIDLRFGEKIFVNEEIAAPETEAATSSAEEEQL